jgi:chaperonin cofactor prefoldin
MSDVRVDASRSAVTAAQPSDYELLRMYEPVLAFTEGEMFFPMRVDGYVRSCSLTARSAAGDQTVIAERGALSIETLDGLVADEARGLSLRFVEQPLGGIDYQRWRAKRPPFRAKGRLSRVGLFGRLPDAVFRLTFLLRGQVPGGTAASAQIQYARIFEEDPVYAYYGRVVRAGRYTVLSYQFLYAMNDWRSSFFGVNDHEADWEQVFVYLSAGDEASLEPAWVAYASHDFRGADLRRRWDDPDLILVGCHPVVFVGAGSHASYFQQGEYIIAVELRLLKPLSAIGGVLRRFWRDTLKQGDSEDMSRRIDDAIRVPFVDYARGDGARIGPGEEREWTPALIDQDADWLSYRGLWGLDTRDVFSGEQAPAGPRYNRDGSVRHSWYDPVGWVELDAETPPGKATDELSRRMEGLRVEMRRVADESAAIREALPRLTLSLRALTHTGTAQDLVAQRTSQVSQLEGELRQLVSKEQQLEAELEACERFLARAQRGPWAGPKDHIRVQRTPEPVQAFSAGRIAELWAAVSIGLLVVLGVGMIVLGAPWFTAVIILIAGSVFVDSILRGSLVGLLLNATIVLAVIAVLVLVYQFFWWLLLVAFAAAGMLVLANNLREIRLR